MCEGALNYRPASSLESELYLILGRIDNAVRGIAYPYKEASLCTPLLIFSDLEGLNLSADLDSDTQDFLLSSRKMGII